MEKEKDIKLLMALFENDINRSEGPSHITDLMILTIKSLMPSEDYAKVSLDYKRYSEELKLWAYYRHGDNKALLNIVNNRDEIDSKIYWKVEDDSVYSRILPLILTNVDYSIIKSEVLKNILFTTGNIETLIEGLLISKLVHLLILDEENIIEKLKDEIIKLTQVDFLEDFEGEFRTSLENYEGNFSADFERSKIKGLSLLNSLESNRFNILKDCINVAVNSKDGDTNIGKAIEVYLKDDSIEGFESMDYYEELGAYVYRLRNGRIDPKHLKIEKYHLPDIFELDQGEVFHHSLLNKSKIIKKENRNNKKVSYVSTKSGTYKFVK